MKNNIGTYEFVNKSLHENDFKIKKQFGQNFLTDSNVLTSIVDGAELTKEINCIEIGPGLGSLTELLAMKAKKVLCYEIDKDLIPILNKNLKDFDNVIIKNEDILKVDINKDIKEIFGDEPVYLVANLPYYITTPILLGLLSKTTLIKKYVVMMQDEVALRICSKPDVKDYNSLSIAIQYRALAKRLFKVSRHVFIPEPNVDSAVISLTLYDEPKYKPLNESLFFTLVRASFAQRRKTLANNLKNANIKAELINSMFIDLKINPSIRSEALDTIDFVNIADYLFNNGVTSI